jgi:hypothetical protein
MENQKILNYLEVKETVDRMLGQIDKYELMYLEDKIKDKIMAPLLDDGFQQDDIELLFKVLIANALSDQPRLSEAL